MSLLHPGRPRTPKPLVRPQYVFGVRVTEAAQLVWATPIGADHEGEPVVAHAADLNHGLNTICRKSLSGLSIFAIREMPRRHPAWCGTCWLGPFCGNCGTPLPACRQCLLCLTVGLDADKQIERRQS